MKVIYCPVYGAYTSIQKTVNGIAMTFMTSILWLARLPQNLNDQLLNHMTSYNDN